MLCRLNFVSVQDGMPLGILTGKGQGEGGRLTRGRRRQGRRGLTQAQVHPRRIAETSGTRDLPAWKGLRCANLPLGTGTLGVCTFADLFPQVFSFLQLIPFATEQLTRPKKTPLP